MLILLLLGAIIYAGVDGELYPKAKLIQVQTADGVVEGAVRPLERGEEFFSFKGIPYAAPPLGNLRFRAPRPHGPWEGVKTALQHGNICPQGDMWPKLSVGNQSEDCLYLNVYTPTLNKSLPVMVWIHGGAFLIGSGDDSFYDPKDLLNKEVVVVTFNYRLEVLGFLNLGLPEITGNAGMKDQVAVLKWVQKNIKNFGGDPGNVSIFGESAGGMSVSLHLCSPLSRGLFSKAIMQSGVFLKVNDIPPGKIVSDLGKILGKETEDPEEMLEFLTNIDFNQLVNVSSKMNSSSFYFSPNVESQDVSGIRFITKQPIEYILNAEIANVPTLAGYNSLEAAFMMSSIKQLKTVFESTPEYFLIEDCKPDNNTGITELRQMIYNVYSNKIDSNNSKELEMVNIHSDITFCYPTHRFFNLYTAQNSKYPSYLYYFDYPDSADMPGFEWKGASHGADLNYLFNHHEHTNECEKVMTYFRDMWTNFAHHGNPTPDDKLGIIWQPYTRAEKNYMIIRDNLELGKNILKERMAFWDEMYKRKGLPY